MPARTRRLPDFSLKFAELIRSAVVMLLPYLLPACAVVSHDITADPIAAKIAGQCFELQQDTYLVNTHGWWDKDKLLIPTGVCRNADGGLSNNCHIKVKGLLS